MNVTFKIERLKNNDEPLVTVTPEVTRRTKRQVRAAFFYAVDGALHKEDPRQTRMDLREVKQTADTASVEAKSVNFEYAERRVE